MDTGGSKGGPKHDINVTPLVDVVLVLLIIFIVTMPVLMRHLTVEIPRKLDDMEVSLVSTQISICALADGSVRVTDGAKEQTVPRGALAKTLREFMKSVRAEKVVHVDFDDNLPWDQVMSAMDTVKSIGSKDDEVKVAMRDREKKKSCVEDPSR